MALSRPNSQKIFDTVRGRQVEKTPEEAVRQRLIHYMCEECGFPKSLIAVEKSLKEMPHLEHLPESKERRTDIVCFARDIHPKFPLYPLVLAECKADAITKHGIEQALGYNAQIGAPFVLLASPKELRLYFAHSDGSSLTYVPYLLHYQELVHQAKSLYA